MSERRWGCKTRRCGWIGTHDKMLRVPNPFDSADIVTGCPECKAIDNWYECCDEPGCTKEAQCGMQTPSGYRRTCHRHWPELRSSGTGV